MAWSELFEWGGEVGLVSVVGTEKGRLGQSCQSGEEERLAWSELSEWGGRKFGSVKVVSVGRERGWLGKSCQRGEGERLDWSVLSEWEG